MEKYVTKSVAQFSSETSLSCWVFILDV